MNVSIDVKNIEEMNLDFRVEKRWHIDRGQT